ncbi:SET domain-containing protein 5 [Colletotrichum spinosum]|uniref:SET domain-containing protein 5 n=1 Tax=Colletotrichum spinosum TaxID=1347390 RepID=A0A4R8QFJ2_9PEZI|nr:SET domain-containing protein 5 [Colletotrichum spinosum]
MFAVRQAAGKGLGAFAVKLIPTGRRILADKALLTFTSSNGTGSLLQKVHALTAADKSSLLQLSRNPSKSGVLSWVESLWLNKASPGRTALNHEILNIFRNNNFNIGDEVQALFPQVARLNHSCVPNAQGNFNKALGAFTVHATRDIKAEEEITISYLDEHLGLRDSRQSALQDGYGFACNCPACSSATSAAGEARRAETAQKLEKFAELASQDPNDEFQMMMALLEAYDAEKIRGREVATMYVATARKAFDLGKPEQGRDLALKGLRLEEEAVGEDSPFYTATRREVQKLGIDVVV